MDGARVRLATANRRGPPASCAATALWHPPADDDAPLEWAEETYRFLARLASDHPEAGVRRRAVETYFRTVGDLSRTLRESWWLRIRGVDAGIDGSLHRILDDGTVRLAHRLRHGTFTVWMDEYLAFLEAQFRSLGGRVEEGRIENVRDLTTVSEDLVVNCTGAGAHEFLRSDPQSGSLASYDTPRAATPLTGLLHYVLRLPGGTWSRNIVLNGWKDGPSPRLELRIVRQRHDVLVSGLAAHVAIPTAEHSISPKTSPGTTDGAPRAGQRLWKACQAFFEDFPGPPPGPLDVELAVTAHRTPARTEYDALLSRRIGKTLLHAYGYGAHGLTLSWGAAGRILELARAICGADRRPVTWHQPRTPGESSQPPMADRHNG